MKIRLKLEDKVITATLIDNKTTQDFISLLPLTLALEDYAGTEKISDLPRRLSIEDAPSGSDSGKDRQWHRSIECARLFKSND